MFTKTHEGHKFERIRNVYEKRVDQLNREMSLIKRKIDEYDLYVMHLVKQSEALKKAKDDKVKDLLGLYRTLNHHLDTELNNRMLRIEDEKRKVEEDLEYFESIHQDMNNQLKHLTPAKVIARSSEFLKMLADINSKKFNSSVPKTIVSDFGNSISIKPAVGSFVLKPYSIYKNSNEIVYSDPLIADGITWRIKIYPNGTGAYKNIYLSLFVEMVKGWSQVGSYCYKITLVKPERESENVEREYVSEFENSICWGYNRFIKIEDLENQGFLDREKDQFTLRYHIRPAHHLQKISDQSEYISYLEQSVQKEKGYSRKLKQKVKTLEKITEKEPEEMERLQANLIRKSEVGEVKINRTESINTAIDQPKEEEERASVESGEFDDNSKDKNGIVDSE
jgi:tripartite motif-containing protein 37